MDTRCQRWPASTHPPTHPAWHGMACAQGRGSSWQDSLVLSAGGTQLSGVGPAAASAAAGSRQVSRV